MSRPKPHELPSWPRLMRRDLAAAYVDVSASTFDKMVKRGEYPPPLREGRRTLWDRVALDRVIDIKSGLENGDGGWGA